MWLLYLISYNYLQMKYKSIKIFYLFPVKKSSVSFFFSPLFNLVKKLRFFSSLGEKAASKHCWDNIQYNINRLRQVPIIAEEHKQYALKMWIKILEFSKKHPNIFLKMDFNSQ